MEYSSASAATVQTATSRNAGYSSSALPISKLALAAAIMVMGMFLVFFLNGVGQDPLQFIHPLQEYLAILLRNPVALRFTIGLDNLFIILYASLFLAIGIASWQYTTAKSVLTAACALMGLAALLDLAENMHFLAMLSAAEQGLGVQMAHIEMQMWESLIKFHVSYLGLFLLGFALPATDNVEKALCFVLRWIQLPVGLLIYLTPKEIAGPLVLVRFTFFFLALLAIAIIFRPNRFG